ncbi:MAG: flagellar hook basal-body protein [Planctomycetes bacterium]|nr:flagellar hook basal-body protein [Planctomycetota bacterium]
MENGLQSGVDALGASQKRMEYIAANLANLQAPGYKRIGSFTHVIEAVSQGRKRDAMDTQSEIDFSQGAIEHTGNPLDLALDGDGFFVLENEDGETYTRNGRFHLDEQGALLSEDGSRVAWEGSPALLQTVGEKISIDSTGAVTQGKNPVGRLRLADFAQRSQLALDGKGNFHAPPSADPVTPTAQVRQASLERSNSNSVDELVSMIRVQRSFENATNLIRTIDQSYKRLNTPK